MATNKMNDGVGRKIVEALKMQTNDEVQANETSDSNLSIDNENSLIENVAPDFVQNSSVDKDVDEENFTSGQDSPSIPSNIQLKIQAQLQEQAQQAPFQAAVNPTISPSFVDNAFQQSLAQNLGMSAFNSVQDDFDYPANVAVLKQLIGKLPAGVSKQTGALIIRQTMEALGISMQSVLQEAKQVQETLKNNSNECQATITEYRKQIGILEAKSQQYQRQYAVMNDIISLFIQTCGK